MRKLGALLSLFFVLVVLVLMGENRALANNSTNELCNGMDDDGDGLVDEDWPLGEDCWDGYGPCREMGHWVCGTQNMVVCKVVHTVGPKPETCNGIDDDCDGLVDDMPTPSCYVESEENNCSVGRMICDKNQTLRCVPIPPTAEVCGNDFDEDCNGVAEICIGDEQKNGVDGGALGWLPDTENVPQLGTPCRPVYMSSDAFCSYSTPSPHPLLPISAVLVVIGATAMLARRRHLL